MELVIGPTGEVTCLYSEEIDLPALGRLTIHRASHVEPTEDGLWTADRAPVGGPRLGPFPTRSLALECEVQWLQERLTGAGWLSDRLQGTQRATLGTASGHDALLAR